jgi:hypothetical protein
MEFHEENDMRKLVTLLLAALAPMASAQTFPARPVTLENYSQPVRYLSTEDYTQWAQEQFERGRRIIERLGLVNKK